MDRKMIRFGLVAVAFAAVALALFPLALKADDSFLSVRSPVAVENDILPREFPVSPLPVEPISHDTLGVIDHGLTIAPEVSPTFPISFVSHESAERLALPGEPLRRVGGAVRRGGAVIARLRPLSRVRTGVGRVFSFCGRGGCG